MHRASLAPTVGCAGCDLAPRTRSRRHEHQVGRAGRRRQAARRRQPADRGGGRSRTTWSSALPRRACGDRGGRSGRRRPASACPGSTTRRTACIRFFTNLPGPWAGHPLAAPLSEALGVPVRLINDARAFTLAEARVGAGQGCAVDGRGHARHRRRRRHRAGRPPPARRARHRGRDRPPGDRLPARRAAVRVRQHRLPRVLRRWPRRWRGGGHGDGGRRLRGRRTRRAARARGRGAPGSTTSRSASRTSSRCSLPTASCSAAAWPSAAARIIAPLRERLATHVHLTDPEHVELVHAALGVRAGAIGAALRGLEPA